MVKVPFEKNGKGKKFQVQCIEKNFTRCGSPLRKEIYKSHREDEIVSNECFQGPSLEKKKLNEILKKKFLSCCFGGKKFKVLNSLL